MADYPQLVRRVAQEDGRAQGDQKQETVGRDDAHVGTQMSVGGSAVRMKMRADKD